MKTVNNGSVRRKPSDGKNVKETRNFWNEVYEWIDCAVITVVVILLVFTFLFRQVRISGNSMYPTLQNNERVIVSDLLYTPKYGDIVVISSEVYENLPIIKRVIATEGQWIDIRDGEVLVGDSKNDLHAVGQEFIGNLYTEAVLAGGSYGYHEYPLQIPEGKVFVLGDNRTVSLDSRTTEIGLIDRNQILGKALYRVYPFENLGSIYKE